MARMAALATAYFSACLVSNGALAAANLTEDEMWLEWIAALPEAQTADELAGAIEWSLGEHGGLAKEVEHAHAED